MPDVPTTFNCPHCQAVYPYKQALIDRPVRCTSCKKPFRLLVSGVAEPVVATQRSTAGSADAASSAASAPSVSSTPSAALNPQRARTSHRLSAAQPSADDDNDEYQPHKSNQRLAAAGSPAPASTSTDSHKPATAHHHHHTDAAIARKASSTSSSDAQIPVRRRSSSRLNAMQEKTRRLMTSTLNAAATQALEKVSQQSEVARVKSDRISKGGGAQAGGVKEIGPAVLTGEGQRQKRLPWWAWTTIATVGLLLFLWIFWPQAAESKVLERFGSGQAAFLAGTGGARLQARENMTVTGGEIQPLSSLRRHRLGQYTAYNLESFAEIVGHLQPLLDTNTWIEREHHQAAVTLIEDARSAVARWRAEMDLWSAANEANDENNSAVDAWGQPLNQVPADMPEPPPSPQDVLNEAVVSNGWAVLSETEIRQQIAEIPSIGALLLQLWEAPNATLRTMAAAGQLPRMVAVRGFTGVDGLWNMGFGDPQKVPYEGRLIRFMGNGVDDAWRLFDLRVRQQ